MNNKKKFKSDDFENVIVSLLDSIGQDNREKYGQLADMLKQNYNIWDDMFTVYYKLDNILDLLYPSMESKIQADILLNGTYEHFFRIYIERTEGSSCSVDKVNFILRKTLKHLKNGNEQILQETYQEYKDNGGNLGGINETNTNMSETCYWCPKTLKTTTEAIELFNSWYYIKLPKEVK
jgi:hypothetical protein